MELIILDYGINTQIIHQEIPSFIQFDSKKKLYYMNPSKKSDIGDFIVRGTLINEL